MIFKAETKEQAWKIVDTIYPHKYTKDANRSSNAGYPVYGTTDIRHYNDYICDLGDHLEVNLSNGSTFNIWIGGANA